jgi:fibronectin-binding autotransporter adhesin
VDDIAGGTELLLGANGMSFSADLRASTIATNNPPASIGTAAPSTIMRLTGPFTGTGNIIKLTSPSSGIGQDAGSTSDAGTLRIAGNSPGWQGQVIAQAGSGAIEGFFNNATDRPFGPNALVLHNEKLILSGSTANALIPAGNDLNIDSDLNIDLERFGTGTNMTYQMGAMNLTGNRTITQTGAFNSVTTFTAVKLGGDTTLNINYTSMTAGPVTETTPSALTKDGLGTLVLSGANTYTGRTAVLNGTLQLGTAGSLPNTPLTTTGGLLDLNGRSAAFASLSSNADPAHGAGTITTTATGTSVVTIGGTSSFAGNINDGGMGKIVSLNLASGAALSLSGASSFSGGTNVPQNATLSVRQPLVGNALGVGSVSLAGGTLSLTGQQQILAAGQQQGLSAQLFNVAPVKITAQSINPNFNSLGTMNAHLGAFTPTVSVQTTTGGKDNFDFSNSSDASLAPFGRSPSLTGDTTADYGFPNTQNYEARFTGFINVPQAGTAVFSTTSDVR